MQVFPKWASPNHCRSSTNVDGSLTLGSSVEIRSGTFDLKGNNTSVTVTSGYMIIGQWATLRGIGTITVSDLVNNGTINISTSGIGSVGTLFINGNYTQGANGELILFIKDTSDYDILQVQGISDLAGKLTVLNPAANLAVNNLFCILGFQSVNGVFLPANITLPQLNANWNYNVWPSAISLEKIK